MTLENCAAGSEALLALYRDYQSERLPHAILLTGIAGVGKKTFASLLAQALLCTGEGKRPCGMCRNCRRFVGRTHPDALFPQPLPKEKSIKIDSLREVLDTLSRHSLEGGHRVVVIENAERMTPQAQNCLLKTLEEAPEDTTFFLTADVETAILPTIRSRCRVCRVQPWEREKVEQTLLRLGASRENAQALSYRCEGSLGRALTMMKEENYPVQRDLVYQTFFSVRNLRELAGAEALLKDSKDIAGELLEILEQTIHARLIAAVRGGPSDLPPHWDRATPDGLRRILESVFEARKQKNANVSWAAISNDLMQKIVEEVTAWQV